MLDTAIRWRSLVPLSAPLTSSHSVIALLDVLARPRGITRLALQIEQTSAGVPRHLSLDALAAEAAHVMLDVPLIETVDHGALVATLQKHVLLTTEVTLDIHLSLEVFKHVTAITVKLQAQGIEVDDRGLGRHETTLGQLTT